jgi:tetratricopeptide (TPR) repeat protein
VARSPLQRVTGTPYDDAWRAMNQMLIRGSIAAHQRNVFLRNDGRGGFDDVSGTLGLDLDQDGRSFAVFDQDGDGDPDLAVMAARQAPQLRVFRNDFPRRGAALALRLVGKASNRDAIGARVRVETDRMRRVKEVHAGSGFLSQHTKELLFGLGDSRRVVRLTIDWPSGRKQELTDIAPNQRLLIEEGGEPRREPFRAAKALAGAGTLPPAAAPSSSWLYEPFPAPELGRPELRGRPSVVLLWSPESGEPRAAKEALARAGVAGARVALDDSPQGDLAGKSFAILYRHLFMNRQPLLLPTSLLLDPQGGVVKVYRGSLDVAEILRDVPRIAAPPAERLARALPFAGAFHSETAARNYLPYGRELLDQGLPAAAIVAFERAAQGNPTASTLYQLGTLLAKGRQPEKARASFERALALQPDLSEANNDLGALLAEQGDVSGAIERFRAALVSAPDYPDALNNLGYALLLSGRGGEARALYEKALRLQPDFAEAANNLGLILAREGELQEAEPYFRQALRLKPTTARPPTTWRWCSSRATARTRRSRCCRDSSRRTRASRTPTSRSRSCICRRGGSAREWPCCNGFSSATPAIGSPRSCYANLGLAEALSSKRPKHPLTSRHCRAYKFAIHPLWEKWSEPGAVGRPLTFGMALQEGSMRLIRSARAAVGSVLMGLLCFTVAPSLHAQTTSASVAGTVNDTQGAVLPGATVTLTSKTQGNVLTAVTDGQGRFTFPIIRPDTYSLTVTMQGFKTLERTNLVVNANDRATTGILTMEVGGLTESVSVNSRISELQVESGERSFTMGTEALTNIAANGRMMFNFALLVPGRSPRTTTPGPSRLGERPSRSTARGPNSEQHDDRRRREHRHRRQRRQHGDDQHRRRGRGQVPDERLPGRVRARGRRPAAGRDQERHAAVPRLGLLVRPALRLGRQQLVQQPQRGAPAARQRGCDSEGQVVPQRLRLHVGRPGLHPRSVQRGQEEAVLLLEPGVPAPDQSSRAAHHARADRSRAPR